MKKTKPIIGLTTVYYEQPSKHHRLSSSYEQCVLEAGGLPIILPLVEREDVGTLADAVDAVVLTGGADIPPQFYGEELTYEDMDMAPIAQIQFELLLIKELQIRNKPIFGVCLGHQLLNIVYGGSLYQDIPTEVTGTIRHNKGYRNGKNGPFAGQRHRVYVEPGSKLHRIVGAEKFDSMSYHHQAVHTTGPGVKVSARASDGIIEATEFPADQLIFSVQWHPEIQADSPYTKRMFEALVREAAGQPRYDKAVARQLDI